VLFFEAIVVHSVTRARICFYIGYVLLCFLEPSMWDNFLLGNSN